MNASLKIKDHFSERKKNKGKRAKSKDLMVIIW